MPLKEITPEELVAKGVVSAPNILEGTPRENKLIFDRMAADLLAPAHNAAVRLVNSMEAQRGEWNTEEADRKSSEKGRKQAETGRVQAEALRVEDEDGRQEAESGRVLAENARVEAEGLRAQAETARAEAENTRGTAEQRRLGNEETRVGTENSRILAEQGRVAAENGRAADETARASAEAARRLAEEDRIQAETGRADAEQGRQTAETNRENLEIGYVAQARNAAADAKHWAEEAQSAAGGVDDTAEKWATTKVNEAIATITDEATFRTYFYDLRKSQSRKYQFEVTQDGVHENIVTGVGGRPRGADARDKAFIYVDIPYSEAGGYVIHVTYELRDKTGLWEKSVYATLNSGWRDTGWIAAEDRTPLVVTVDKEGGGGYKADYNSSDILAAAQAHRAVIMRYTDTDSGLQTDVLLKGQSGGLPLFYDTWMSKDGKTVNRIDATVDYDANVDVAIKSINAATTEDIAAAIGTAIGGAY